MQETYNLRQLHNVSGLRAFLSVDDVEGYLLAFVEGLEALALNCAEMYEDVLTFVGGDEPVPFGLVEPLYSSLCHKNKPPEKLYCHVPT